MELTLKYGRTTQTVNVDDRRVIAQVGLGQHRRIEDVAGALARSLAHPVGPALEEVITRGDRVLLMTVDHTRPNPSPMLLPLMERVEKLGGKPEVMIGLGNHRAMTAAELDAFVGMADCLQNDSRSEDQWRLGTTSNGNPIEVSPRLREFDKRIVVGFIEPHYIAGYSGGRKMVMPGCGSFQAISDNHFLLASCGPQLGVLEGNPVHEDMLETARAVGVDWICDAVVNPDDSLHLIVCGELEAAHGAGVQAARRLYGETIPRRADIVICCSGGHPYDTDMVQAKKGLAPAMQCVKPGGVVILLGECESGWGATEPDWDLMREDSVGAVREEIVEQLKNGQVRRKWAACSPGLLFSQVVHDAPASLIVVSSLAESMAGTYLRTAGDLGEALAQAEDIVGADAEIIAIHDGRRAMCKVTE